MVNVGTLAVDDYWHEFDVVDDAGWQHQVTVEGAGWLYQVAMLNDGQGVQTSLLGPDSMKNKFKKYCQDCLLLQFNHIFV